MKLLTLGPEKGNPRLSFQSLLTFLKADINTPPVSPQSFDFFFFFMFLSLIPFI